jgi:hypothetical protein
MKLTKPEEAFIYSAGRSREEGFLHCKVVAVVTLAVATDPPLLSVGYINKIFTL